MDPKEYNDRSTAYLNELVKVATAEQANQSRERAARAAAGKGDRTADEIRNEHRENRYEEAKKTRKFHENEQMREAADFAIDGLKSGDQSRMAGALGEFTKAYAGPGTIQEGERKAAREFLVGKGMDEFLDKADQFITGAVVTPRQAQELIGYLEARKHNLERMNSAVGKKLYGQFHDLESYKTDFPDTAGAHPTDRSGKPMASPPPSYDEIP